MYDLDIWGAKQYLDTCENLSYVGEYMRQSQLVLQKTKKLIPVSKSTSYEVVADVSSLHCGSHTQKVNNVPVGNNENDIDTNNLMTDDIVEECASKKVFENSKKIADVEMKNLSVLDSSIPMFNNPEKHVMGCNGAAKYSNDCVRDVATSNSENHLPSITEKDKASVDLNHSEMRLQQTNLYGLKHNTRAIAPIQDIQPQIQNSQPNNLTDFEYNSGKLAYNPRSDDVHINGSSGELMRPFLNLLVEDISETSTNAQVSCQPSISHCLSLENNPDGKQWPCDSLNIKGKPKLSSDGPLTKPNTLSKAKTDSDLYKKTSLVNPQEPVSKKKAESCKAATATSISMKEDNELPSKKINTIPTIQYDLDHQAYIDLDRNHTTDIPISTTLYTYRTMVIDINIVTVPDEIMLKIFTYLSRKDLRYASLVCKRFNRISKDADLWMNVTADGIIVTNEWFESLKNRKSRSVVLQNCTAQGLSSKSLRSFFQSCRNTLRQVHVSCCKHHLLFGDNILLHVTSYCNMINTVSLPWSNTTNNGISALACSNIVLKELNINGNCFVSDESFIPLLSANTDTLRSLKLNGCFALSCESFIAISKFCNNLEILHMGLCSKITTQCIQDVCTTLKNLRSLDLRSLKSVTGECICAISKHCKCLVDIVLANCTLLDDNCIAQVTGNLPALTNLDISGCSKVTDQGIGSLAVNLVAPKELNLSNTAISYLSVHILTENCFDSMTTLKLSFCNNITNDSISKLISFCYNLSCLHLHGCKRIKTSELGSGNNSLLRISL